jgi:two-component system cell cycle sensor histidine kinase/response regulator CckA
MAAQRYPNPEEAMAHLAAVVESSEDAIISKTLASEILTWNAGAERVYGYTAAEAIGRNMTLLLPDNRSDEEAKIVARIARGERVAHFETVRRNRAGELIDVSLTISPIRDSTGRITGASHIARNITERKRLDKRLYHLAAAVESSEDAIITKTLESTILSWNFGAERVYGYSAAETLGRKMTMLLPEDRADEEAKILERIGRGERVEHFETVRRNRAGERIDVSLTISPIRDESGQITGASHIARNITERKELDAQLRHSQKLESLGVLAGGVAHDFNNLLLGIMGNASLALEILPADNSTRGLLKDVVSASERAADLTRQLLAYAGKGRFLVEPVNLSELVRDISALIQTSIPKNVQLRLDLRDSVPLVQGDSSQLQQIIMNLVINAAEAILPAESGTVVVTTGSENTDGGLYASLEVRDSGCGMDEETINRIFDPFFTTKFTGRGLGLAAVQGIVQGHNGVLKVNSREGQGSTFTVLFPATRETLAVKAATTPDLAAQEELVLVVDDEETIRRTAKAMLEHYGYTVVVAADGKEAVDLFRVIKDKVTAVLLDMTMPVMNGEEAFEQMKAIRPDVKVVLSSGYNEVDAIRRFTGKGIAGFIQKPYPAARLAEKLKSILTLP